jgi:hypothetical protein
MTHQIAAWADFVKLTNGIEFLTADQSRYDRDDWLDTLPLSCPGRFTRSLFQDAEMAVGDARLTYSD